jgi:hypothetical protein
MNREHYLESDSRSKNIYQKLILLFFWGNIHLTFKGTDLNSLIRPKTGYKRISERIGYTFFE